jgi:hypothetical protein
MADHQSEIENAIQNDLTPEDRAVLERAREVYRDKARGRDLDDWLFVLGKAHNVRIKLARKLAGSPNRNGSIYNGYMHRIMEHDGVDTGDKKMMSSLTAVAWVCDEEHPERLERLAEARAQMSPGELATFTSPHTARKLIKKLRNEQSGYEAAPKPVSTIAKIKQENKDYMALVAHLEERLASSSSAGSLFDWERDSVRNCAAALLAANPAKARRLRDALSSGIKGKTERVKALAIKTNMPAG